MRRFTIAALVFTLTVGSVWAGDTTLRWYGQSFFVLTTAQGTKVAFDPHHIEAFGRQTVTADLVLMTHPHPDHVRLEAIENRPRAKLVEGFKMLPPRQEGAPPRVEWNILRDSFKDVKFRTVGVYHDGVTGMSRGKNSVFVVEADGVTIAHLGDLGHLLSPEQVKQIGPIDVLLIPVGGVYTINGEQAKEVVAQLKPRQYVVPMHYGVGPFEDLPSAEEFLDGQKDVQKQPNSNELILRKEFSPPRPVIVMMGWKAKS